MIVRSALFVSIAILISSCGGRTNQAPIFVTGIIAPTGVIETNQTFPLRVGSVNDPDGDSLVFSWYADRGAIALSDKTGDQAIIYLAPPTAGQETVTVVITDNRGGTTTDSITFSVSTASGTDRSEPPGYRLRINGFEIQAGQDFVPIPYGSATVNPPVPSLGTYPVNSVVTISVIPDVQDSKVQWSGVDTHVDTTGVLRMNQDRFLAVGFLPRQKFPTKVPDPTPTPVPTPHPTPIPTSSAEVLPTPSPASIITTIDVRSTQPWTATGITVGYGDKLTFVASGEVIYADPDDEHVTGPNGTENPSGGCGNVVTDPAVPAQSLIGNIADSPSLDGAGFFIGPAFQGSVPFSNTSQETGELLLGFNDGAVLCDRSGIDNWGFTGDNSGSFTVKIIVNDAGGNVERVGVTYQKDQLTIFDQTVERSGEIMLDSPGPTSFLVWHGVEGSPPYTYTVVGPNATLLTKVGSGSFMVFKPSEFELEDPIGIWWTRIDNGTWYIWGLAPGPFYYEVPGSP